VNSTSHPRRAAGALTSRIGAVVLLGAICALLAAVPAGASASTPSVTPADVSVSSAELATIKLDALGAQSSQLAAVLADIPALGALSTGTLDSLVEALPANSTLQSLLSAIKTATGVEVTAGEVTQVLLANPTEDPAALATLLGDVASLLQGTAHAPQLQEILENVIDGLTPEQLQQLETVLGISGTPQELAGTILDKLAEGELTSELATAVDDLGTTTATTGSELATALGTTPAALAGTLGMSEGVLDSAAGASTPLASMGGMLTALANPDGLTLATVPSGLTGGTGGNGASGTNGANGTSSTTTTTSSTTSGAATPAAATKTAAKSAKIQIVSHKVKGDVLTLVVKVPAAGSLTVSAAHAKAVKRKATKAGTLTVKLHLTRAGAADVRRHHNKLSVKVTAAFKAAGGTASAASATVRFG
jgi:hypothetical protein